MNEIARKGHKYFKSFCHNNYFTLFLFFPYYSFVFLGALVLWISSYYISFVIKSILELKKEWINDLQRRRTEKRFCISREKNKKIIRETYGITKRKNFKFPNPKIFKYEYDYYDKEHQIHE